MKTLLLIIIFLFASCTYLFAVGNCDGSGNCYVRKGAGGSGTGAEWTDACTDFTGACAVSSSSLRGTTLWVASGTYTTNQFTATASGTTPITINAATTSSHGPAVDWSSGYAGQVVFGGDAAISTSYWVFNGQEWAGSSCTGLATCGVDAAYHIYFHNTSDHQGYAIQVGPGTNFTLSYVDMGGPYTIANWSSNTGASPPATNDGDDALVTPGGALDTDNLTVDHSYLHDVGVDLVGSNNQTSQSNTNGHTHIYDHDFFAREWYTCTDSGTCNHAQGMSECLTGLVVRYSTFLDVVEDGIIDVNVISTCPIADWDLYGNTIEWDNNIPSVRQANVGGFLGFYGQTIAAGHHVNVYNNTYAGVGGYQSGANVQAVWICWSNGVGSTNAGTVNIYNNLFWQSGNSTGGGTAQDVGCGTIPGTSNVDYGQGYCPGTGCTNGAGYSPTGAHAHQANTGNPFVNWDGSTNFNVSLVADTPAGLAITGWSSAPSGCTVGVNCENIDPLVVTRGANGIIDRGAFQISGAGIAPAAQMLANWSDR